MVKGDKQMKAGDVAITTVIVIIVIAVLGILAYGFYMGEKAHRSCNQICTEVGAITNDVHHSGNWNKLDDVCICYKTTSILTIRIDEWNALTYLAEICEHNHIQDFCPDYITPSARDVESHSGALRYYTFVQEASNENKSDS